MAEVVLVCGPPCVGKSSWVRARVTSSDVVVDLDDLEVQLGDRGAARALRRELEHLASDLAGPGPGRVWVVRTLADPADRADAAARLGAARVHVLTADRQVLVERAASRPDPAATLAAIDRWLAAYGPAGCDSPAS